MTNIKTVKDLQLKIILGYMRRMMSAQVDQFSSSGLDKLDKNKSYLFISNHRDIAMDPAFVSWSLNAKGFETQRNAIGDNLLTKPFIADVMRINKSFIVNRSASAPREKFKAAKHLSAYIHHCITEENSSAWIAQREGRAKDGIDNTNPAVISMLALSKPKHQYFSEYITELNIVPVSISYQWDPCDAAKANELLAYQQNGVYKKNQHEDAASIAAGITGQKGNVHVAFGDILNAEYPDTDAVATEIDRQINNNYCLHPSNCAAYQQLTGELPAVKCYAKTYDPADHLTHIAELKCRLAASDTKLHNIILNSYANVVRRRLGKLTQ